MDWSLAERYLCQKKDFFDGEIAKLKDEIQKMKVKKGELYERIKESEQKIDEAYEVFAVNPARNNIIKKEIQTFRVEVEYLTQQIMAKENTVRNYECERGLLHQIFHKESEKQTEDKEVITKEITTDMGQGRESDELTEDEYVRNITQALAEVEIDMIEQEQKLADLNTVSEDGDICILDKTIINDLIYRCENLKRFMNVDRHRSQIEMGNIIEILQGLR